MRVEAVLLAAGAGRRFGGSKLTADYRGRPLLTYALDAALQAPVERVVLVTGFHAEAVRALALRHAPGDLATRRLALVHAPDAAEGMAASLRAGLLAVSADDDAVFVFLGDMPGVPAGLAPRMVDVLATSNARAVVPVHEGQRGHPVLFCRSEVPEFLKLRGDQGGKAVLTDMGALCVELDGCGEGVIADRDVAA